jgi:hypothetical protein
MPFLVLEQPGAVIEAVSNFIGGQTRQSQPIR